MLVWQEVRRMLSWGRSGIPADRVMIRRHQGTSETGLRIVSQGDQGPAQAVRLLRPWVRQDLQFCAGLVAAITSEMQTLRMSAVMVMMVREGLSVMGGGIVSIVRLVMMVMMLIVLPSLMIWMILTVSIV